jgi:NAD(P)-dependent dehydrogenase (short-subunit alcohol dehydrogenase family)
MTDISETALAKAMAKAKELMPNMAGHVATMKCDVSKESDVQAIVERLDEWGGVDVMFNNAGIMHGDDDGKDLIQSIIGITANTSSKMPSPRRRRSGTSPTTSTSKASGSAANTPFSHSASTRSLTPASSIPLPSSRW